MPLNEALRATHFRSNGTAKRFHLIGSCASTRSDLDHLAGIHDVLRVECTLEGAHGVELDLRAVVLELMQLDAADPVLGRDRAAIAHDEVVDRAADRLDVSAE